MHSFSAVPSHGGKRRRDALRAHFGCSVAILWAVTPVGFGAAGGEAVVVPALFAAAAEADAIDLLEMRRRSDAGDVAFLQALADRAAAGSLEMSVVQVALVRARALAEAHDSPRRHELLVEAIARREKLLRSPDSQSLRETIALEQAHDLFLLLWPLRGTRAAAIFGTPDDAQASIAALVHAQLFSACEAARGAPRSDDPLASTLRENLDLLAGAAAVIRAEEVADVSARHAMLARAAEQLGPQADLLPAGLALEARLYCGLALAQLGRFDEAEAHLRAAAVTEGADPTLVFMARMGAVVNRTVRGGAAAGIEALKSVEPKYARPADAFFRLIIADHHVQLLQADGSTDIRALAAPVLALLETDFGLTPTQRAALVLKRLERVLPADTIGPSWPPECQVAAGLRKLEAVPGSLEAVPAIEHAIKSSTMDRSVAHVARMRLAQALRPTDPLRSLRILNGAMDAARTPDARAEAARQAGELALSLASASSDAAPRQEVRGVLEASLKHDPDAPASSRWRTACASLLVEEGLFAEARAMLATVDRRSDAWVESRLVLLDALPRWAAGDAVDRWSVVLDEVRVIRSDPAARESAAVQALAVAVEASAHLAMGHAEEAAAAVRNAPALPLDAPSSIRTRLLAAQAQAAAATGDIARAEQAMRLLLDHQPAAGLATASRVLHDCRRFAEASAGPVGSIVDLVHARVEQDESPSTAGLRLELARTALAIERWSLAASLFAELLKADPDSLELLTGRAESLHGVGRASSSRSSFADAMAIYRRLSASASQQDRIFWLAELRLLQILDAVGEGAEQIPGRIARLRLLDSTFGGELTEQFEELARKHPAAR
jgi:tetratricopeptide (TPR) repeat protein